MLDLDCVLAELSPSSGVVPTLRVDRWLIGRCNVAAPAADHSGLCLEAWRSSSRGWAGLFGALEFNDRSNIGEAGRQGSQVDWPILTRGTNIWDAGALPGRGGRAVVAGESSRDDAATDRSAEDCLYRWSTKRTSLKWTCFRAHLETFYRPSNLRKCLLNQLIF